MNNSLFINAEKTVALLKEKGLTVSTAESCTGGMLSCLITSVSGASEVFELGVTSYSNRIKNKILSVKSDTLEDCGAVSKETVIQMAENVRMLSDSDIGVAVTGVAGPSSSEGHPAGYVFIALADGNKSYFRLLSIEPKSREFVRQSVCDELFSLIELYIKGNLYE